MHAVIQGQSHGHAHAHGHMHGPSRGERLVARHDQNDDGKLGIDELADTRLGRRMSVARFARIDTDGDAMLSAAELDNVKRGRGGAAMKEAAMRARYADYLVQQVENTKAETDIATRVIQNLDGDDSGGLNSEEIAGTRLAEIIGAEFYNVDADKSGALDKAELSDFLAAHLSGETGQTEPAPAEADETAPVAAPVNVPVPAESQAETAESDVTAADTEIKGGPVNGAGYPSATAAYSESIRDAFEAALKILQDWAGNQSAIDVVKGLYTDVQDILKQA